MTPADPRTGAELDHPADPRTDTELRAWLAATPLREPAPDQVRRWQATLRKLPPPARHGRWARGSERPETWPERWIAVDDTATTQNADPTATPWPPQGRAGIPENLGAPSTSTRAAAEGPPPVDETTSAERSGAPAGGGAARGGGSAAHDDDSAVLADDSAAHGDEPGARPSPNARRLITPSIGLAPLSSDRNDPSSGAPTPANISIAPAKKPSAMATRPLTMADARMAVAKIRRATPRSGVAAAIGGLAAAITAVAVLGPSAAIQWPSSGAASPSAQGPAATAAGWPGDHPPTRPATRSSDHPPTPPTTRSTDHPADSEPLTLTRGQLLATPPTGRDLGPLAAPATLTACLARFGPSRPPVAARRVVLDGRPGVLLVLPTELPGRLRLLVVDPRCSTAVADDIVGR